MFSTAGDPAFSTPAERSHFSFSGHPFMINELAVARLKPGVTLAQARAEMEGISQRLARAFPATNEDMHVTIEPLHPELVRTTRLPLLVLWSTNLPATAERGERRAEDRVIPDS